MLDGRKVEQCFHTLSVLHDDVYSDCELVEELRHS